MLRCHEPPETSRRTQPGRVSACKLIKQEKEQFTGLTDNISFIKKNNNERPQSSARTGWSILPYRFWLHGHMKWSWDSDRDLPVPIHVFTCSHFLSYVFLQQQKANLSLAFVICSLHFWNHLPCSVLDAWLIVSGSGSGLFWDWIKIKDWMEDRLGSGYCILSPLHTVLSQEKKKKKRQTNRCRNVTISVVTVTKGSSSHIRGSQTADVTVFHPKVDYDEQWTVSETGCCLILKNDINK